MDVDQIQQQARVNAQSMYCGDHLALCRVLGRYMMYVDTRDLSFSPHMMLNGFWERWITKAIYDTVKPGMVCADVGACVGYFTVLMADLVGPDGHVYCFEPNPKQMELIKMSLDVNGLFRRVTLINKAVSDTPGTMTFKMPTTHPINGTLAGDPITVYDAEEIEVFEVEVTTVDSVVGDGKLDFMKADIEGAELDMFRGLQKVWERNPQLTSCVEYVPGHYNPRGALPQAYLDAGARLGYVTDTGAIAPFDMAQAAAGDPAAIYMLWALRK